MDLTRFLPAAESGDLLRRLRSVIDPEIGVNIVDLGLVYECDVNGGLAYVLMTTTTPACPIGSFLEDQIRWALLDAPGVVDVEIEVTHDPAWTPALLSPAGRAILGLPA